MRRLIFAAALLAPVSAHAWTIWTQPATGTLNPDARILMQQTSPSTSYTYTTPTQILGAGLPGVFSTLTTTGPASLTGGGTLGGTWAGALTGAGASVNFGTGAASFATTALSSTNVTAAGSSQGTATALTSQVNVITSAAAGAGVVILATVGVASPVVNRAANPVNVYPPSGAQIDSYGANNPVLLGVGASVTFECFTSTQCRMF